MIGKDLCEKIGIKEENHIKCAYMDLLLQRQLNKANIKKIKILLFEKFR